MGQSQSQNKFKLKQNSKENFYYYNEMKNRNEKELEVEQQKTYDQIMSLTELETTDYRLVNNVRIKQIIEDYQSHGNGDPISMYKKDLYKKSSYAI